MYYYKFILILPLLFIICLCEIVQERKDKLLSDFINYYNLQPNHNFKASEGYLQEIEQTDTTTYKVVIKFTVQNDGPKFMQCTAIIQDLGNAGIAIENFDMQCGELLKQATEGVVGANEASIEVDTEETGPVKLENEVQGDKSIASGEQFIAIRRNDPKTPCMGCTSFVNPEAKGVRDLAELGVRHLDLHESTVKHSLDSVIEVERQVQVVNGVRYILTLSINFNNCSDEVSDTCNFIKVCKIAILTKPWLILPNGSKYRAIISNNCTEEWLFGDNGEVLPEFSSSHDQDHKSGFPSVVIDDKNDDNDKIDLRHREEVQSQPNQEKALSIAEIRAIEKQILPNDNTDNEINSQNKIMESTDHIVGSKSVEGHNNNLVPVAELKHKTSNSRIDISLEKKKAIDDLLDFINFTGCKPKTKVDEIVTREKRSYDHDLQVFAKNRGRHTPHRDKIILGGQSKQDPNNLKYIKLANLSLQKYLTKIGNSKLYRVLLIENVTRQVVSGTLTRIDFLASPMDNNDGGVMNCHSKIWQQPWLKENNIDVSCKIENQRIKRHVLLPGGQLKQDVNNPKYTSLAAESLQKYLSSTGSSKPHRVIRIEKVTTQVVAGSLTEIDFLVSPMDNVDEVISCHSTIWEQPWLEKKDINVSCKTENQRVKRDVSLSGGQLNQDVNNPKYTSLAAESLQKYLSNTGSSKPHRVIRIENVTTQVVAGSLTKIDFLVSPMDNVDEVISCHSTIWEQSWLKKKDINVSCKTENQRVKRDVSLSGGQLNQDVNNPKYTSLAAESLQKYLSNTGSSKPHRVIRIENVTTQVVAGSLTKIDFLVSPMDNVDEVISCHSTIWEQSWLKKKDINVSCKTENQRVKKQIADG